MGTLPRGMVSAPRPSRRLPASVLAATVLVLCGLVALASRSGLHGALFGGKLPLHTRTQSTAHRRFARMAPGPKIGLPSWIGWAALGIVAALLLVMILRHLPSLRIMLRTRGRADPEGEESADFRYSPVVGEEEAAARQQALREAVLRSLEEIRRDPDARRAIIGAYRLMEAALADTGLPRGSAEAPREYLARALATIDVGPQAPRRLTALFERARFHDAELDLSLRDQAVDALIELREAL
jgi:hypothetical protein